MEGWTIGFMDSWVKRVRLSVHFLAGRRGLTGRSVLPTWLSVGYLWFLFDGLASWPRGSAGPPEPKLGLPPDALQKWI